MERRALGNDGRCPVNRRGNVARRHVVAALPPHRCRTPEFAFATYRPHPFDGLVLPLAGLAGVADRQCWKMHAKPSVIAVFVRHGPDTIEPALPFVAILLPFQQTIRCGFWSVESGAMLFSDRAGSVCATQIRDHTGFGERSPLCANQPLKALRLAQHASQARSKAAVSVLRSGRSQSTRRRSCACGTSIRTGRRKVFLLSRASIRIMLASCVFEGDDRVPVSSPVVAGSLLSSMAETSIRPDVRSGAASQRVRPICRSLRSSSNTANRHSR